MFTSIIDWYRDALVGRIIAGAFSAVGGALRTAGRNKAAQACDALIASKK
jgi:hypothetical protein